VKCNGLESRGSEPNPLSSMIYEVHSLPIIVLKESNVVCRGHQLCLITLLLGLEVVTCNFALAVVCCEFLLGAPERCKSQYTLR